MSPRSRRAGASARSRRPARRCRTRRCGWSRNGAAVHRLVVERPAGESPLEAVCQVLRSMILELAERREESLLRQQVIERLGPDRADPSYARLVGAVAVAAARSAVSSWRAGQGRRPLAELVDATFVQLRDLASPPAPPRPRRR